MESVQQLLKRVARVGIKADYLQRVLPSWVDDYPPTSSTGLTEIKVHLARELGLDLRSLAENHTVSFGALPSAPKYKRTVRTDEGRLKPAASMFYSLARALSAACRVPYAPVPAAPDAVRAEILRDASAVTLSSLLTYLWNRGIPVAHYSDWPERLSRPFAMAIDVEGRPVIIVGSQRKENAWHAFYTAHELGHITLGHLGRNGVIVDADDSERNAENDGQERDADAFATQVLAGAGPLQLPKSGRIGVMEQSALDLGRQQRIDPGHLLLRYAMESGRWDLATAALQRVEAGADAPVFINRDRAEEELDFDSLSEDRKEFVRRVLALA